MSNDYPPVSPNNYSTIQLNNGDPCPFCQKPVQRRAQGVVCHNCNVIFQQKTLPPIDEKALIARTAKEKQDARWATHVLSNRRKHK